jgi:hypothetical protein
VPRADAGGEGARAGADRVGWRARLDLVSPGRPVGIELEEEARQREPGRERQPEVEQPEERKSEPRVESEPAPAGLARVAGLVDERALDARHAPAAGIALERADRGRVLLEEGPARDAAPRRGGRERRERAPERALLRQQPRARLDPTRERLEPRALGQP